MKAEDEMMDKLLLIEKVVDQMLALREQIAELKEWEAGREVTMKILQANEQKLKTLVENIPQKMYLKDRDSVYVFGNEKYTADLKMKPEDIAGRTDYQLFPMELAEKYVSDDKRIMATGQSEDIEERYVQDGQSLIVHTIKTPVKSEAGKTVGILGIFWDITGQKRKEEEWRKSLADLEEFVSKREAELETVDRQLQREIAHHRRVMQQLQEMDEMFWAFFENTGTAAVTIEENLIVTLANREFERLAGYPREEVEWERSLSEFLTPEGVGKIKEFYSAGITNSDNILRGCECQFIDRGGQRKDLRITAAMVPGAQKAVVSLVDITEGKRSEEALRELKEKFQGLVESLKEAILVVQNSLLKCSSAWDRKESRDSTEPLRELLNSLGKISVILNGK